MPRRRVDWSIVVGPDLPASRPALVNPATAVTSVLALAEELTAYTDADELCRRAVELARDRMHIERVGLYLEDPATGMMNGMWGTGARGQTVDERGLTYPVGAYVLKAHALAESGEARWLQIDKAPLVAHIGGATEVLGQGWFAMTPIRVAHRRIGMMFNDTALSRAPLDRSRQVRLAVFCSLLGTILDRHLDPGAEAERGPLSTPPGPVQRSSELHPHVRKALQLLHDDLTLTSDQLAAQIGTSAGNLARVFKRDLGESIVAHRNRRRLEVFFSLADGSGENLLRKARLAGFGSYAQFHRVFRATLGATPSEYLTGHPESERPPAADDATEDDAADDETEDDKTEHDEDEDDATDEGE